jgi:AraC-like DNA-binding protein
MLEAALTRPAIVTDVRALADALGVHRKTVFNRCAQAGFLAPAEMLLWARLCLAGYLLETTGHTVESMSLDLGYPSPTALRNTMKRYTGLRPTAVRSGGGLALVIARLGARLQRLPATIETPSSTSSSGPLHIL